MSDIQYFCPRCQGADLTISQGSVIIGAPKAAAHCQLCGWNGTSEDVIGAISPENEVFWTGERVANALLTVTAKHAAGPLVQCLELIGIVPPLKGCEAELESAAEIRAEVMRAVLGACATAAFETAASLVPAHYERFSAQALPVVERAFCFAEKSDVET